MASLYVNLEGGTEKAWAFLKEAAQNNKALENSFTGTKIRLDVYDERYQEALGRLISKPEPLYGRGVFVPYALRCARIYRYMDKDERAKECYEQAKDILESEIKEDPKDARFRSSLGIAYAGLGRKEEAIREGRYAIELMPVKKDAMRGTYRIGNLAHIYVMLGEYDKAISQLDFLLHFPGGTSIHHLRLSPAWDPLREHPDFKQLVGDETRR